MGKRSNKERKELDNCRGTKMQQRKIRARELQRKGATEKEKS